MVETQSTQLAIAEAVARHVPMEAQELVQLVETPPSPEMGDYALPCFPLAGRLRRSPAQIAGELKDQIETPEGVGRVEANGPYLNFFIDRVPWTRHVLQQIRRQGRDYGGSQVGADHDVVIEFSSPNIAKHLGIHHLPSTVIGMALYRIYTALGYQTTGINYLGDWGTSFGKLIAAVERYGIEDPDALSIQEWMDLYVRFSAEAEGNEQLQQAARDAFRRLEEGQPAARRTWAAVREASLAEFQRVYDLLGVEFDRITGESQVAPQSPRVVDRLLQQGVAEESQGAVIVPLEDQDMPPCMVRKSDGTTIYAGRDIPAALQRWEEFGFERSLYVVGNDQSLYFQQLKAVLRKMGCDWAGRIEHVNFGLIKFLDPETGEARVGSTRRGEVLYLQDVLDEAVERARAKIEQNRDRFEPETDLDALAAQVGIGAVVFRELSVRRTRDVVFDWDRMLDFEGDTGPYVQYAHARLCSILRKADQEATPEVDFARLSLPEEWVLLRHLERFPAAVLRAARENEPSVVANYLLELCADFSSYYSAGMREPERRVLCDDPPTRAARLLLVDATRRVIHNGLALLGVQAPERM